MKTFYTSALNYFLNLVCHKQNFNIDRYQFICVGIPVLEEKCDCFQPCSENSYDNELSFTNWPEMMNIKQIMEMYVRKNTQFKEQVINCTFSVKRFSLQSLWVPEMCQSLSFGPIDHNLLIQIRAFHHKNQIYILNLNLNQGCFIFSFFMTFWHLIWLYCYRLKTHPTTDASYSKSFTSTHQTNI